MTTQSDAFSQRSLPRTPRWTGVLAIVIASSALLAGWVQGVSGSDRLVLPPLAWMPWELWAALGVLGVCVVGLRGAQALAAADALSLACAWICVIPLVSGVSQSPQVIQTILHVEAVPDLNAQWTTLCVLLIGVALGVLGVCVVVSSWRRWSALATSEVPRSPFRVEVLVLIAAFAIVALVQSPRGPAAGFDAVVGVLAFVVPVTLTLALSLRRRGPGSVWIAGLLAFVVLVDLARLLLGSDADFWGLSPMSQGWADLLLIALVVVLLLWNSVRIGSASGVVYPQTATHLDPWSGVAFILAFVPLLSVPAVVLGHFAYEHTMGSAVSARARSLAGSAIVIGMVNAIAILAIYFGIAGLASDLFSNAVGGL
jgi:hypothetical protein